MAKNAHIPLQFGFSSPKKEKLTAFLALIESIEHKHDDLERLLADFKQAKNLARSALLQMGFWHVAGPTRFSVALEKVRSYIDELCNIPGFFEIIHTSSTEIVNGFQLLDCDYTVFDWEVFNSHRKVWKSSKTFSRAEFKQLLRSKIFDFSWRNRDPHGTNNDHYDDNYRLNVDALVHLPYPQDYILEIIDFVQKSTDQSARLINFYCEWMKRKMAQVDVATQKAKLAQQQMIIMLAQKIIDLDVC